MFEYVLILTMMPVHAMLRLNNDPTKIKDCTLNPYDKITTKFGEGFVWASIINH